MNKLSTKGMEKQQYRLFIEGIKPGILFFKPLRKHQQELVDILLALNYPYVEYYNCRILFFQNNLTKNYFETSELPTDIKEGLVLGFPSRSIKDHYYNTFINPNYVLVDFHGIVFVSDLTYVEEEILEMQEKMPVPESLQTGIRLSFTRTAKRKWEAYESLQQRN